MANEFREIPRPPNGYYHTKNRSEIRIFGCGGYEISLIGVMRWPVAIVLPNLILRMEH